MTLPFRRITLSALVLAGVVLAGCEEKKDEAQGAAPRPVPEVGVVAVATRDVQRGFEFVGRVVAIDSVELRARVQGFLEQRLFTEGSEVKAGDLLFTIEKAPFQASVDQAAANLASAQAVETNAQLQYDRAATLGKQQNIPQATVDTRKAELDSATANVQVAQAALEEAQINLGYTSVTAPFGGKIGRSIYSVGAVVGPSSEPLASIVSQDPIYVTFPVTTRQLLEAQKSGDASGSLAVKLRLSDGTLYDQTGKIDFVNNKVDATTDTVEVRAVMPNPKRELIDGQLAGVIVELAKAEPSLVIPQAALLADQSGSYVLVAGADNKVEQRRVTLGQSQGTGIVVTSGLKAGDNVIVQGLQRVRPGMEVKAQPVPAAQGA
ncbi:MAG: efflux RND transporter periplasmic adaptor subunit [Geminicoccaceae bacterium]